MAGVYISFPFCPQKCTYCNFISGVFPEDLEREYVRALLAEMEEHRWQWRPETVYLGGGSPCRIPLEDLEQILARIPGAPWVEATIEADPGAIALGIAAGWRKLGINRVSLGVQSFVESELRQTGRKHTAPVVERAVTALREAGIPRINIDLIAGLPYQTRESWDVSLSWIERIAPDHVSVYMLEVDEDSRLGSEILHGGLRYGAPHAPSADLTADFYEAAVNRLEAMGMVHYEISNFARPGFESAHNLKYWRLEPYVGFGADAHSFDGRMRRRNAEEPAEYVRRMKAGRSACIEETEARLDEERFFVGLRLLQGIQIPPEAWRRFGDRLQRLIDEGLLEAEGAWLRLTKRGVLLSNEVFQEFLG